ncbi:MAG: hypothetical protein U5J63_11100 [Fodinibius sp.]|nr:hypothetical protein [Fodinibius sp.]
MHDVNDDGLADQSADEGIILQKSESRRSDQRWMIPKLDTAFEALRQDVQNVHIKHANNLLKYKPGPNLSL